MTLEDLKNCQIVTGTKQVTKAINRGVAAAVFIAGDAEIRVTRPLRELCAAQGVPIETAETMAELGKAAGISVGAAAAAVLNEPAAKKH